jgi:hypothetical protein
MWRCIVVWVLVSESESGCEDHAKVMDESAQQIRHAIVDNNLRVDSAALSSLWLELCRSGAWPVLLFYDSLSIAAMGTA